MGKRRGRWQIWARDSNMAGVVRATAAARSAVTCDRTPSWPRTEERMLQQQIRAWPGISGGRTDKQDILEK